LTAASLNPGPIASPSCLGCLHAFKKDLAQSRLMIILYASASADMTTRIRPTMVDGINNQATASGFSKKT